MPDYEAMMNDFLSSTDLDNPPTEAEFMAEDVEQEDDIEPSPEEKFMFDEMNLAWEERLHPRARGGRFARKWLPSGMASVLGKNTSPQSSGIVSIGMIHQEPLQNLDRWDDFHPGIRPDLEAGDVFDIDRIVEEAEAIFADPPSQEEIAENLTYYRQNVARWTRAVESVVADILNEPRESSSWSGNIKFDTDDLVMADAIKEWECDISFLSSMIVGWKTGPHLNYLRKDPETERLMLPGHKPWGLITHEILHAFSNGMAQNKGVSVPEQKHAFAGGWRMIEEGIVEGLKIEILPEVFRRLGTDDPEEPLHEAMSYRGAVSDFRTFADYIGMPRRRFFEVMIKTPITKRPQMLRDLLSASKNEVEPEAYPFLERFAREMEYESYTSGALPERL